MGKMLGYCIPYPTYGFKILQTRTFLVSHNKTNTHNKMGGRQSTICTKA